MSYPQMPVPRERPGMGLVLVGIGVLVILLGFFGLPWAEAGGETASFMEVRDAWADSGDEGAAKMYASWVAFTTFGVVVLIAVPAAVGLNTGATIVFRTLAAVAAAGAVVVHYVGVWQMFYDNSDVVEAGAWIVYLGYATIGVGAVIGPRKQPAWPHPPSSPVGAGRPPGHHPASVPPPGVLAPPPAPSDQLRWPDPSPDQRSHRLDRVLLGPPPAKER